MIEEIGHVGKIQRKDSNDTCIIDCRPYLTAYGNKIKGKGYETKDNYRNVHDVHFCGIKRI
jgi:hypothetical protein